MTDERYKQIMNDLGMPNSWSLLSALRQVANEAGQEAREECATIAERGARLLFPAPRSGRIVAQNVSQAIAACIRGMAPPRAAPLRATQLDYEAEKRAWVAAHPNCTAREYAETTWAIKKRMGL